MRRFIVLFTLLCVAPVWGQQTSNLSPNWEELTGPDFI